MRNKQYSVSELNRIKELLPYSYAREIQKRITKSNGKKYSLNHIRKSMMYKNQQPKIIQAAIDLIEETGADVGFVSLDNW